MDVRFINPFISSITNVFKTMLSTEMKFGKPHIKTPEHPRPDVSAVIGFSGDATGAAVLGFRMEVASRVASTFSGVEMGADHADFADALGELANMVAGGAKANFGDFAINISLPSVIVGQGHEVLNSQAHPSLVIPCESPLGPFTVDVSMKIEQHATAGATS